MPKSSQTQYNQAKPVTRKCPHCGANYLFIANRRRRCPSCNLGIVHKGEALHVADCPLMAQHHVSGEWIRVD